MRQKNITPYEVYAPGDPFLVIAPGEIVNHPHPLTGCMILAEDNGDIKDSDETSDDENSDEGDSEEESTK